MESAVPIVDVVDTYARVAAEFDRWLADRIVVKYGRISKPPTGFRERQSLPEGGDA